MDNQMTVGTPSGEWFDTLDERQQKEVVLAMTYARYFHHGTTGHNAYMLIARLVELLEQAERGEQD